MVTRSVSFYSSSGTLLGSASSLPANVTVDRTDTVGISRSVHLYSERDGLCESDGNLQRRKRQLYFSSCPGCKYLNNFPKFVNTQSKLRYT